MSNKETPVMHPDFPRWYRAVDLEENRDRLHHRFNGLSDLIKIPSRADVEGMIRVAFRPKQGASPEVVAHIRQKFKDADDLFDMQGNDRELEILCGAALAVLFERNVDIS